MNNWRTGWLIILMIIRILLILRLINEDYFYRIHKVWGKSWKFWINEVIFKWIINVLGGMSWCHVMRAAVCVLEKLSWLMLWVMQWRWEGEEGGREREIEKNRRKKIRKGRASERRESEGKQGKWRGAGENEKRRVKEKERKIKGKREKERCRD